MYRDYNGQLSAWFTSESAFNLGLEDFSHLIDSRKNDFNFAAIIGNVRMRLLNIGGKHGAENRR
jgi:hypothetical protein